MSTVHYAKDLTFYVAGEPIGPVSGVVDYEEPDATPEPVCAVAGGFPNLPRTLGPMSVDPEDGAHKRCPVCKMDRLPAAFRYRGGRESVTCLDCRSGR